MNTEAVQVVSYTISRQTALEIPSLVVFGAPVHIFPRVAGGWCMAGQFAWHSPPLDRLILFGDVLVLRDAGMPVGPPGYACP